MTKEITMAEIVARNGNEITLQVTVTLTGSMMDMENAILDGCNEIGCLATTEALQNSIPMAARLSWVKLK